MAHITLVTGGSRSGKSTYAEKICVNSAQASNKKLVYIATCPKLDKEMDDRIRRHQALRANMNWLTVEEELDLVSSLKKYKDSCILVECLTLWINNLMWRAEQNNESLDESKIYDYCQEIIQTCKDYNIDVTFVTNETGMGIMPVNDSARLFSDLSGRANQTIAQAAQDVYFMVSSLAMKVK